MAYDTFILSRPVMNRTIYFHHKVQAFEFNIAHSTDINTLSLHDALPILPGLRRAAPMTKPRPLPPARMATAAPRPGRRSEEHTSELQSRENLVCRLLLEKKNHSKLSKKQSRRSPTS